MSRFISESLIEEWSLRKFLNEHIRKYSIALVLCLDLLQNSPEIFLRTGWFNWVLKEKINPISLMVTGKNKIIVGDLG